MQEGRGSQGDTDYLLCPRRRGFGAFMLLGSHMRGLSTFRY
jgi:hypothetical protein